MVLRSELARRLRERFPELRQDDAMEVVDTLFDAMKQSLAEGRRIELRGFGSFSIRSTAPRRFRNPKTGEERWLPQRRRVVFRPGKGLKRFE